MSAKPEPSDYLPTLDGWRAIAVLGVIVFHVNVAGSLAQEVPWFKRLLEEGMYGVDLFFAISGFLITTRLLDEQRATGGLALGSFYGRRAFRILPPAFLYLALVGTFAIGGVWLPNPIEWLGALFFFRNYVDGHAMIDHLWSLCIEEHFYFLWPALFLVVARGRRVWIVIAIAAAIAVWRSLLDRGVVPDPIPYGQRFFHTDYRIDALFWGCALAMFRRMDGARPILRRLFSLPVWLLAVGVFLGAEAAPRDIATTLHALSAPIIIVSTIERPTSLVSRALEWKPLRWIGRLSYSLYLFQQAFLSFTNRIPHAWLLILPVACASYYIVERPMIRLGRDLLAGGVARAGAVRVAIGVAFFVVTLGIWTRIAVRPPDQSIDGARVLVYEHPEFFGAMQELGIGRHYLTDLGGIGNDSISSIKVGRGAHAYVCTDIVNGEGAGECHDLAPGAVYEHVGSVDDRLSFIEVFAATP